MSSTPPLPNPAADPAPLARARQLAAQFAEAAAHHDATGEPPAAQFDALQAAGLLRLTVDREYGGDGAGLAAARAVIGAIAYGDPSVALILSMHYCQHAAITQSAQSDNGDWPIALARRLARQSVDGRALVNAAQVEPELGSPSHGGLPDTVARRNGDTWRLSGRKLYVTGGPLLSWISVLARTDEPELRLGHFLVPRDADGVRIVETWDPIGMRASVSHDVILTDVAVPLDDVVGLRPARLGLQRDPHATAWYFSLVSTVYDGVARAARDWLIGFLNERRPSALGGAPLASLPSVQEHVGRIETLLAVNAWLLDSHARHFDAGDAPSSLAAVVKQTAIDNATRAVDLALELAGNHGLARRNPLERHHRNVLCGGIHAPSNALLRSQAGRAALSAFGG
ncbi:acyl-CoA dehydrogenase [Burkholderia singularis]|uniref:Acyl-CoA dehydrogenase n=1 Tax=Burkholderia singularis TaxID=1503053 RepID=A0A118DPU5_9BURK|nr:acyl-CoA dehydrogenase family protein [Burkholderia singularis]KVE28506.1 acyl-CoA dehydrogenase [Burkholderia singularis]